MNQIWKIKIENDDSGNELRDGDAEGLFFFAGFSRMAKNGFNMLGAIVGRMKTGVEED